MGSRSDPGGETGAIAVAVIATALVGAHVLSAFNGERPASSSSATTTTPGEMPDEYSLAPDVAFDDQTGSSRAPQGPATDTTRGQTNESETTLVQGGPPITPCDRRFDADLQAVVRHIPINEQLLRAVMAVESACDPTAVSPEGAIGLMQVVPATGGRAALRSLRPNLRDKQPTADALRNPRHNLLLGATYLYSQWQRFAAVTERPRQRLALALAAYNAGPTRVAHALDEEPPDVGWSQWVARHMPRETQRYVERVFERLQLPSGRSQRLAALMGSR